MTKTNNLVGKLSILRMRKTAWLAIGLMVFFMLHRILLPVWHGFHSSPSGPAPEASPVATLVLSRSVLDGKPFGIDSEFVAGRDRVHAFLGEVRMSDLLVKWYRGGDLVATLPCPDARTCPVSLGPDSLAAGEWSVDLLAGTRLLATTQFRVLKP